MEINSIVSGIKLLVLKDSSWAWTSVGLVLVSASLSAKRESVTDWRNFRQYWQNACLCRWVYWLRWPHVFFFGGGKKVWLECVLLVRAWCHVLANGTMLCYVTVLWWTHEDVFSTNYLSMTFFELVHQQCEWPLSLSRSSFHLSVPCTWFCDQVVRGASRWKQEVSAGSKSYSRGRKESGIERLACGHLLAALQDDIMDVIGELCFWYTSRHVGADCGLSAWPTRS